MTLRKLLSAFLLLGLTMVMGAPAARADHDDDDNYRGRDRRFISSSSAYVPYASSFGTSGSRPYGYRPSGYSAYGYRPNGYRTYSTYNPYSNSSYGYYDDDSYRYYRNDTGSVAGRELRNALSSGAFR